MSFVFWNAPPRSQGDRLGDPLGLDALREAMADCLVPYLTGGTRHADDYLWILVGLRWAKENAASNIDSEIWEEFRIFERALKQYWEKFTSRSVYAGKNVVSDICKGDAPN